MNHMTNDEKNGTFKTPQKNFMESPSMLNITSKLNSSFKRSARLKISSKILPKRINSVANIRKIEEHKINKVHAN